MGLCIFNLNFAFLFGCPQIIDKHPNHVFRRLLHWKKGKILLSPNLLCREIQLPVLNIVLCKIAEKCVIHYASRLALQFLDNH